MTETLLLASVSGAVIGIFLRLFGGGGSVLAAPLLLYVVGVEAPHTAIGTAAVAVAATAVIGLIGHARVGRVKWPCATVFALSGIAGAYLGALLATRLAGEVLLLAFAGVMAAVGLSMFRRPAGFGDPEVTLRPALVLRLAPLGAVTGGAAGFFGIGGGFLIVPGLMAAVGMTLAHASAASLVSVALFGATTSVSYAGHGFVDWPLAGALIIGGIAGSLLAAPVSGYFERHALLGRRVFGGLVIVVAVGIGVTTFSAL